MEKKLFYYMVFGFVFSILAGIFLSFGYQLSNANPLVGMFCPVNFSPWETVKIVFFPAFFYFLCGWIFFYKTCPRFIRACFLGLISGSFLFFPLFYTYSGILGIYNLFLTALCAVISTHLIYYFSYDFIRQNDKLPALPLLVSILVFLLVCFFSFTYAPPELSLFSSPYALNM